MQRTIPPFSANMLSHTLSTALVAATLLSLVSHTSAQAIPTATAHPQMNSLTDKGCWSSSGNLVDHGPYTFQSKGNCQPICYELDMPVMATANGTNCWCGTLLPPKGTQVDDSECNTPCDGIDTEYCGSATTWSVYLTGVTQNVIGNYDPSSSSSAGSSTATVVTVGGSTVLVTQAPATSAASKSNGGGSTNKAAIAAGVVVGIVALCAICGGVYFFLRRRRQQQAEEEYRRKNQVVDFMGKRETPATSHSHMNDSILDPEVMLSRRQSDGSIADNQDYSRRLRVTNPDDR